MSELFSQQITWVYTYKLSDTAKFYKDLIGLEQVLDQGFCRVFRATKSSFIGVCQRPDRHVEPKGVILTLITKDVDAWHRRMVENGVRIHVEPKYSESSQSYVCVCLDPEGYRIEFQEFRDPRWRWPEGC